MKDIKWPPGTHMNKKKDFLRYQFECNKIDDFVTKFRKEEHEKTTNHFDSDNMVGRRMHKNHL